MSKNALLTALTAVGGGLKKAAPAIMVGAGIGVMVVAMYETYKQTPEFNKDVEETKAKKQTENQNIETGEETKPVDLTKKETVVLVAKHFWKPIAIGAGGAAMIIGGYKITAGKLALMAVAYNELRDNKQLYEDKVHEILGDKKATEIQDEVTKTKAAKYDYKVDDCIDTGKGDTFFIDVRHGRIFKSDVQYLKQVMNDYAESYNDDHAVTENDVWRSLGLNEVREGDDIGWWKEANTGMPRFTFTPDNLPDGSDIPCLKIDFMNEPGTVSAW